jgi:hypothetical protein
VNNTLKTILIVLAVIAAAAGMFFAGAIFGRNGFFRQRAFTPGYSLEQDYQYYGPGMLGRGGGWGGPGMMRNRPGNNGMGSGMMRGYAWSNAPGTGAPPLTVDQARQAAEKYIATLDLEGLATGEIMIFDNNAYVVVNETSTGMGAFELLVDPASEVAYPEHGPNMMWNTKYGAVNQNHMMGGRGGMMRLWKSADATPADVSADMPVSEAAALKAAQDFLDQRETGATASAIPVKFYGYYTFDFTRDRKVAGMLSVNGQNAQVFLHVWHGVFIEEAQ